MTGYGEAHGTEDGVLYIAELRSVNNRYLKPVVKLPDCVQFVEPEIDKLLRARLVRGSVTFALRLRNQTASAAYDVNQRALSSYADALTKIELSDGVQATIDLAALSALPGVCQMPELSEAQRDTRRELIRNLADEALDHLLTMRAREGEALHDDLTRSCAGVREQLDVIAERAPGVLTEYHERLVARVEVLLGAARLDLDKDALCREVAVYAERSDISEETVRLRAHLDHFREICDKGGSVGRKLDFLAQEMLREANTIGSKSNDAAIARAVVELKSMIDRIKEQVQNVE